MRIRRRDEQSAVTPFDPVDAALVRELLESTPDALVVVDGAGRIVLVNGQAERLFGYARSELMGEQVELLVPSALRDEHRRHRERFVADPKPRPIVCVEGQRKDGSRFAMDISLSPLRTETGTVVASLIRDVTEREQAAAELGHSESLFRGLLESAPDAIASEALASGMALLPSCDGQLCRPFQVSSTR